MSDPGCTQKKNGRNYTGTPSTLSRRFPKDHHEQQKAHLQSQNRPKTSNTSCSLRISWPQSSPTRSLIRLSVPVQTKVFHPPSHPNDRLVNRSHEDISRPHNNGSKHAQPQKPARHLLRCILQTHHAFDTVRLNSHLVAILSRFTLSRYRWAAHDVGLEEPQDRSMADIDCIADAATVLR